MEEKYRHVTRLAFAGLRLFGSFFDWSTDSVHFKKNEIYEGADTLKSEDVAG